MHAVLLTQDLLFGSHLMGAASRHGWTTRLVAQVDELLGSADPPPDLLVLDLTALGDAPQWEAVYGWADGRGCPVLAYAPHVHQERLDEARRRRSRWVMPRGQLHRQADRLLADLARDSDRDASGEPEPPGS